MAGVVGAWAGKPGRPITLLDARTLIDADALDPHRLGLEPADRRAVRAALEAQLGDGFAADVARYIIVLDREHGGACVSGACQDDERAEEVRDLIEGEVAECLRVLAEHKAGGYDSPESSK